jgi:flagellar basal body-associated protein FliL
MSEVKVQNKAGKKDDKEKKQGGGIFKKIIIAILALAVLIAVAGGTGYFVSMMVSKNTATAVSNNGSTAAGSNSNLIEKTYFDTGDEFLVNLADEDGKKFIKTKISLAYDSSNKKLPDELKNNLTSIRNDIIYVLRTKKREDVNSAIGSENLRKELLAKINASLKGGQLLDVYYSELIIQ